MILDKVRGTIERFSLIHKGNRVLVAVSGGLDSVVLLEVLSQLSSELSIELAVCHFNHGLRETAERDERFVESLAASKGLPFFCGRADVKKIAEERGMGIEEAARAARYGYFEEVARKEGFDRVALAHTLSDNVETFFLRVIRGAGLEGLKGIPPRRGIYVRPLIEVSREQIMEFARERGLSYVEDETNRDTRYLRNWVRVRLIPLLKEANPSVEETVGRLIGSLREDWELLNLCVESWLGKVRYTPLEEGFEVCLDTLMDLPPAVVRHILFKLLHRYIYPGMPGKLSLSHVEALMAMCKGGEGSKGLSLPDGVEAVREYNRLYVRRGRSEPQPVEEVLITAPGVYPFSRMLFVVRKGDLGNVVADGRWSASFDPSKVDFPLVLRYKRPGDRLFIPGVGRKKLQDFFVDLKVPRRLRERIPLLTTVEGDVLWVVGYRQREDLKPTGREAIMVEVRKDEGVAD